VQETVSDKKHNKDLNGDGTRDEYRAASIMVYDYYPFGMLMPGRSLDTAGLCVTSPIYTEVPHYHWNNAGQLSSAGGGGATSVGGATLTNLPNGGIRANGTRVGFQYTITGIPAAYISLQLNFSYLAGSTSGSATVTVYQGRGTGTSLLKE
jgi:hypothetical protein